MTGEISIHGLVKPVGGVNAKVQAARKAGATKVLIPKDNWQDSFKSLEGVEIIPVSSIKEVIEEAIMDEQIFHITVENIEQKLDILSATSLDA
ncbi:Lon protease 2 [bioreactor metagenome]|uniref:Lon protease 2 n=1 Tax=bioreactor metagenome TaxID=1076179 RepID=A0A645JE51_9ZZZZ